MKRSFPPSRGLCTALPLAAVHIAAKLGCRASAVALALAMAGCVSTRPFDAVPDGSPPLAREGMHGVLVMRAGVPFWKVYSYFHIPGDRGMARFSSPQRCADRRIVVRPGEGIEDPDTLVADACQVASLSLDYLQRTQPGAVPFEARVRLHIVPEGQAAWRRSIAVSRHPRLSLAVPLFEDRQRTLSLVSEIVAHEGSHILDHVRGLHEVADIDAEVRAHRHALCAQLVSLGRIHSLGLPSSLPNGRSAAIARSTEAGRRVFEETYPLLQDGWILAGTPAAHTVMARCREE